MSRTKAFIHNMAASVVLQAVNMLSGIIVPRIMLIYYGSEINGLVSSIVQFISYFNIVEAGLGGAVIFSLYKPLADRNVSAISNIVTAAKGLYCKTGMFFSALVLMLAAIYPFMVTVTDKSPWQVALLVIILGGNGVLDFFVMAKYTTLFTADQRLYVISLANCLQVIFTTVIIFILARQQIDIVVLRAIVVMVILGKAYLIRWYAGRYYASVNYSSETPDYTALTKRWDVLYLQLLGAVQTATPVVLLTLLAKDLKLVSVYVVYNMVLSGVNGIMGIFMNGLQAGFGEIIAKGEINTLQRAYSEFQFMYYNLIGIAFTVTFVTIQPFIRLYTDGITDVDYNVPIIAGLFVVSSLLYNLKTPQGMLTLAAGLYREQRVQLTLQSMILLVLGLCLTSEYGISGVLIAAIASNVFRDVEIPYFVHKTLLRKSYISTYKRMFLCLSFSAIASFFIKQYMYIEVFNYVEWILYLVQVIAVVVIIFAIKSFILERNAMQDCLLRIRIKLLRDNK